MDEYLIKNELIKTKPDEDRVWTVYIHIVPKEIRSSPDRNDYYDKYYVGITSRSVESRWRKNGSGYNGQVFGKAIEKYGWDNIQHEIIAQNLTIDEASYFEKTLISKLDSNNKHGYNIKPGGIEKDYTHTNMSDTRIYRQWLKMKERCYSPSCDAYPMNGGLGIKVCDEWLHNFYEFYNWAMETGYTDDLLIFRRDKEKDYSPDNCYWTTVKNKCQRRDSTKYYTFNGKTQTLQQLGEEVGIQPSTISSRINTLGMSFEEAISRPVQSKKYITYQGETHSLTEWANIFGIAKSKITYRYNNGWPVEKIFIKGTFKKNGTLYEEGDSND